MLKVCEMIVILQGPLGVYILRRSAYMCRCHLCKWWCRWSHSVCCDVRPVLRKCLGAWPLDYSARARMDAERSDTSFPLKTLDNRFAFLTFCSSVITFPGFWGEGSISLAFRPRARDKFDAEYYFTPLAFCARPGGARCFDLGLL